MTREYVVKVTDKFVQDAFQRFENEWSPEQEIVRCKDCKWYHQAFANEGRCVNHDNDFHKPDWFCADGERKSAE